MVWIGLSVGLALLAGLLVLVSFRSLPAEPETEERKADTKLIRLEKEVFEKADQVRKIADQETGRFERPEGEEEFVSEEPHDSSAEGAIRRKVDEVKRKVEKFSQEG